MVKLKRVRHWCATQKRVSVGDWVRCRAGLTNGKALPNQTLEPVNFSCPPTFCACSLWISAPSSSSSFFYLFVFSLSHPLFLLSLPILLSQIYFTSVFALLIFGLSVTQPSFSFLLPSVFFLLISFKAPNPWVWRITHRARLSSFQSHFHFYLPRIERYEPPEEYRKAFSFLYFNLYIPFQDWLWTIALFVDIPSPHIHTHSQIQMFAAKEAENKSG